MIIKNINPLDIALNQNQVLKKKIRKETILRKELENKVKSLEVKAYTDTLTGISNRESILTVLHKAKDEAESKNISFGIILVDIDHFKLVNDNFSHGIGDIVLKTVAEVLNDSIRNKSKYAKLARTPDELYQTLTSGSGSSIGGRYGGEEFLIVVYDIKKDGLVNLSKIAERLRRKLDTKNDSKVPVGKSVYEYMKYNFDINKLSNSTNDNNIKKLFSLLKNKAYEEAFTGSGDNFPGLKISISGGYTIWKKGEMPVDMIERADKALYVSKQNGRNQMTPAS